MREGEKQQQLDREIRDMISALTNRLAVQREGGGTSHDDDQGDEDDDDGENGFRIITLAGSNVGATLRSELDVKSWKPDDDQGNVWPGFQEHEPLTAMVNSNFQAINNSLMLGGSYSTNDPGVHMDVPDGYNTNKSSIEKHQASHLTHGKEDGIKKAKETKSKSDNHSQASDA